jgi:hypothetical protein
MPDGGATLIALYALFVWSQVLCACGNQSQQADALRSFAAFERIGRDGKRQYQ